MLTALVTIPCEGVPVSFQHAFKSYEAVKPTHPGVAWAGLATLRLYGWGVPQDHAEAFGLFSRAAEAAHGRGETGLGIMYAYGYAVKTDYVKAFRYLQMGAAQVGGYLRERLPLWGCGCHGGVPFSVTLWRCTSWVACIGTNGGACWTQRKLRSGLRTLQLSGVLDPSTC
jgi:hypothetical protein